MAPENDNETNFLERFNQKMDDELPDDRQRALFFSSLIVLMFWSIYLAHYNSRVLGLLFTAVLNRVIKKYGHIKFGSFSLSIISGKLMFRDVHFANENYSIRIQYGYAIFRYWRLFKENVEDMSNNETRLSIFIESVEYHIYNHTQSYDRLQKLFGFEDDDPVATTDERKSDQGLMSDKNNSNRTQWQWRDLIPLIKVDMASVKLIFGNYLVPYSLTIYAGEGQLSYWSRIDNVRFNHRTHYVETKLSNFKIQLIPSPGFGKKDLKGLSERVTKEFKETPPRLMEEGGYVFLKTNSISIRYTMDEPGIVSHQPEKIRLVNGELMSERMYPNWSMEVKCRKGKGTEINYSPWADRQRDLLWKLFYPSDYQSLVPTVEPEPNQPRIYKEFEFKLSFEEELNADILFNNDEGVTQALHLTAQKGSYLEFTVPWIVGEDGYISKINGQLMMLEATTGLDFRQLLDCETFQFDSEIHYPLEWNDHQLWKFDITACKANTYLIFDHKRFVTNLVNDWSSKSRLDLYHFIPYTWQCNVRIKEFCIVTLCNEWNWIDCSTTKPSGNCHVALNGDSFFLSFNLPFTDFLPSTVDVGIEIEARDANLRLYLPETHTTRYSVTALSKNLRVINRASEEVDNPFTKSTAEESNKPDVTSSYSHHKQGWSGVCYTDSGWVECWKSPCIYISLIYTYHPIPLIVREDGEKNSTKKNNFDPESLEPDLINVKVELSPSEVVAYGSLLKCFLAVKENYLGRDQMYFSLDKTIDKPPPIFKTRDNEPFDPRYYRPLSVKAKVNIHKIRAHLPKNCTPKDAPCAFLYIDHVGVEIDKCFRETKIQVLTTPCAISVTDKILRRDGSKHLEKGHLMLSALQIRGHAMFSQCGLPLESETLEYGWLVEVTVGELTGRLTVPQLQTIVEALQTFVMLVDDTENELTCPLPYHCQHMKYYKDCNEQRRSLPSCPSSEDLKYRMTRASIDCIDFYVVESDTALNLLVKPIRAANCNLHSNHHSEGLTVTVDRCHLKQYLSYGNTWVECGSLQLGRVAFDAGMALPHPDLLTAQKEFLNKHDAKTKRLYFLWRETSKSSRKCGCVGNCLFFGENRLGRKFFGNDKSSLSSLTIPHLSTESFFGFGQSILSPNRFLLDKDFQNFKYDKFSSPPTSTTVVDGTESRRTDTFSDTSSAKGQNLFPVTERISSGSSKQSLISKETGHDISDPFTSMSSDTLIEQRCDSECSFQDADFISRTVSMESSDRFWSANEDETSSASSFVSAASDLENVNDLIDEQNFPGTKDIEEDEDDEDDTILQSSSTSSSSSDNLQENPYSGLPQPPSQEYPYLGHMTQLACEGWRPDRTVDDVFAASGALESIQQSYRHLRCLQRSLVPKFQVEKQGIGPQLMINEDEKDDSKSDGDIGSKSKKTPTIMESFRRGTNEENGKNHVSKTMAVIKLAGSIDVFISPLLLDGIKQYVESITPVLEQLHACGILDTMHVKSSQDVRAQNKILGLNSNFYDGVLEVTRRIQFQTHLSRIKVVVVQASDSGIKKDCVSLLAVQIDSVNSTVMFNTQTHKSESSSNSPEKNKNGQDGDHVTDMSDNILKEDQVATLSVNTIHAQVRRLRPSYESAIHELKITALPDHRSLSRFKFLNKEAGYNMVEAGVGNIRLKMARRLGYGPSDDSTEKPKSGRPVALQVESSISETDESITKLKRVIPSSSEDYLRRKFRKNSPSDESETTPCKSDASTCILDVEKMWFNCAAPSGGRKILPLPSANDWNFLSTLTPAIEAWMDSGHKLHAAVSHMMIAMQNRITGVMACVMTQASSNQDKIQQLPSQKYSKYSQVAKQLREDPSCILVCILRKYVAENGAAAIERAMPHKQLIVEPSVSELVTLQKGVLALTRHWKTLLFFNPKNDMSKKKHQQFNVKFDLSGGKHDSLESRGTENINIELGEPNGDNDEKASLLKTDECDMDDELSIENDLFKSESREGSPTKTLGVRSYSLPGPNSIPALNFSTFFSKNESMQLKNSTGTIFQTGSNVDVGDIPTGGSTTPNKSNILRLRLTELESKEKHESDINRWVAEQGNLNGNTDEIVYQQRLPRTASNAGQDSVYAYSIDGNVPSVAQNTLLSRHTNQWRLVDAQILFKPLLRAIGLHLEAVKSSAMMRKFGGNCSIMAVLHTLKVDIVDSDLPRNSGTSPATFTCNNFSVDVNAKDVAEIDKKRDDSNAANKRQSIGRLQDALDNVQLARPMTTKMYFTIKCETIEQYVNLSLLRLVHQLVTMIQRVNATQAALKMKKTHRKQDSKSSTDTNHSIQDDKEQSSSVMRDKTETSRVGDKLSSAFILMPVETQRMSTDQLEPLVDDCNCWKRLKNILDLYSSVSDSQMRTITRSKMQPPELDVIDEEPGGTNLKSKATRASNEIVHIPILAFGTMRIGTIKLHANVSGLQLASEVRTVDLSLTHRINVRSESRKKFEETSFSIYIDYTYVWLLVAETTMAILTVKCQKSNAFYSNFGAMRSRNSSRGKVATIKVGNVYIDIPQHLANTHDMMYKTTEIVSHTLKEFIPDNLSQDSSPPVDVCDSAADNTLDDEKKQNPSDIVQIRAILDGLVIGAFLLPSVRSEYEIGTVTGFGWTGLKAKASISIPHHKLSFKAARSNLFPGNIPQEASVDLPLMSLEAEYKESKIAKKGEEIAEESALNEGLEIRTGKYIKMLAVIQKFKHSLSSDLLNHLVFMQKTFRNEINEVLNKISGTDKPVPLFHSRQKAQVLFFIHLKQGGIELMATTTKPAKNALRLETKAIEIRLSNRVKRENQLSNSPGKVFLTADVKKLTLDIIHIHKNYVFQEAEPDFESLASFSTTIRLRNALEHEMVTGPDIGKDTEALLMSVSRPVIEVQPPAFDAAFWIWIDYKNAFEYWSEQRLALIKNTSSSLQHKPAALSTKLSQSTSSTSSETRSAPSALFLQLTVDELCICLPLTIPNKRTISFDSKNLLILTLDSTQISACSRGSLVSKGKFKNFCLRFDEDVCFPDDWKPREYPVMNAMCVPNGTYEVCSQTHSPVTSPYRQNAKWVLNVNWQMKGLDIHLNTRIGEKLAALGKTLTSLADNGAVYSNVDNAVLIELEKQKKKQELLVDDLKATNWPPETIAKEERKLERIKEHLRQSFFNSKVTKIEKDARRALKKQLGISEKQFHSRSKSVAGPELRRQKAVETPPDISPASSSSQSSISKLNTHSRTRSVDAAASFYLKDIKSVHIENQLEVIPDDPSKILTDSYSSSSSSDVSLSDTESEVSISTLDIEPDNIKRAFNNQNVNDLGRSTPRTTLPIEAIDFDLDVKVQVESGQCVLHPKDDDPKVADLDETIQSKAGRPRTTSRNSNTRLIIGSAETDCRTVFLLPGVDIKLRYDSKTNPNKESNKKSGNLYCWLTLQRLSEEMVIKTFLLDFLHQALENVPIVSNTTSQSPSTDGSTVDIGETTLNAAESFPVDVLVYVRVHPSTIRFSCLPAERIECKLGMPSLDIVFSTRKDYNTDKAGGLSVTASFADFSMKIYHLFNMHKKNADETSDTTIYSLVVNVKFLRLSISRTRRPNESSQPLSSVVRFSTSCDIGDSKFEFDMKRLQDILNFPKHWYRSSLARRLFLGEEKKEHIEVDVPRPSLARSRSINQTKQWETRVLFTARFSKLDVDVKIMLGKLHWSTVGPNCQGRLNVDSTGFKNMQIKAGLKGSKVQCSTVVISGSLQVRNVYGDVRIVEGGRGMKLTPTHSAEFNLETLETRIEYMSTNILLGRLNDFCLLLKDEWVILKNDDTTPTSADSTKERKGLVNVTVIGKLLWDKLHLMLTKRTTPDLIAAVNQISQRIISEYVNSMKIFGIRDLKNNDKSIDPEDTDSITKEIRYHRHWQTVLSMIRSFRYDVNGTLTLQGNNLSLACFDGSSFQAKNWVIFTLDEPTISFDTNPRDNVTRLEDLDGPNAIICQSLNFQLGHSMMKENVSRIMATICRVTRSGEGIKNMASSVRTWFDYAFGCKDLPGLTDFPLYDEETETEVSREKKRKPYQHDTEIIFLMPALMMYLLTEHHQGHKEPTLEDPKADVDCKFVTDFYDDISVTINAEALMFLGELIIKYIDTVEQSDLRQRKADVKSPATVLKEDQRNFHCISWRLEPTIKMLVGKQSCEPFGIDRILKYLGVKHASKTIPTWMQRGVLDPLDKFVSVLMHRLLSSSKTHIRDKQWS